MDAVYNLIVRLSLETAGVAAAGAAVFRSFGQIETAAMSAERRVTSLQNTMARQTS